MEDRFKSVRFASILGIIGNLFLSIIKGGIGFFTNSQAMIADAFNSFSDILSSVMTYIGNKIASKPSDDDHNLGHGKAEYIYSMLISIIMMYMAIRAFYGSFLALFDNGEYNFSIWLVLVCIVTIIIKMFLFIYISRLSSRYNNILIRANSLDHRNDIIVTVFTLFACIMSLLDIYFIDSLVGIGISIWIFISAIKIFIDSYDVLMDKSINSKTRDKVYKIISNHSEILKVNHFNSTPVGYRYQISVTIFVDGNLSTFDSHGIADRLEDEIIESVPEIYLAVIHVNPMEIDK